MEALEMITGMVLRPMQGPLTQAQEQELRTLKNIRLEGKALAERYESDLRAKRIPRI
jgi:hypothetical protein